MKHNRNGFTPEAATHEPASPPPGRDPPPGSRPRPPDEGDGLISDRLDRYVPVVTDALGRARRCDGFRPERQCVFLNALACCGVAADAARAAGISRDTAYELRNSASGAAFALAWQAAILISRGRVVDELQSRSLNGVVDRIYRNGELWGERHRHDNRLAMAVLTRLDRQADGLGEGAATARAIAQEWDQFLDIVRDGGDGAGDFLAARAGAARRAAEERGPRTADDPLLRVADDLWTALEASERLFSYCLFGGGLDDETDMSGLEPSEMETWTERGWVRAQRGGLLDSLRPDDWPDAVRAGGEAEMDGTCRSRQDIDRTRSGAEATETDYWERIPGLARARREYCRRFPDAARDPGPVEQTPESDITAGHIHSEGGSG